MVLLGATGSIGRQALEVVRLHPDRLRVVGLAAGRDRDALAALAEEFGVDDVGLGRDSAVALASLEKADVVLNAIVGAAGLEASLAALEAGKTLALANKESLVAGGELCLAAARRGGGKIVPVDSEHAAIAQCLEGRDRGFVERIVLTASGGPFRTRPMLDDVTPDEALAHPTWSMGQKITIDSATMMNKGLEVIEAHFLFGFGYERIGVVVHPQSLIHGVVEFADGTVLMQAAPTDMRVPIQAALAAPARIRGAPRRLHIEAIGVLGLEPVDASRFPAVGLAYEAGRRGRSFPAALNAANEEAVGGFLAGLVPFPRIAGVVEDVLAAHAPVDATDLGAVLEVDEWARAKARGIMGARAGVGMILPGTPRAGVIERSPPERKGL